MKTALLGLLLLVCSHAGAALVVKHDLQITIDAETGIISAEDRISVEDKQLTHLRIALNPGLHPEHLAVAGQGAVSEYVLPLHNGSATVRYSGVLQTPSGGQPNFLISPQGIFLDASSGWFPVIQDSLSRFTLKIVLPDSLKVISQGQRLSTKQSKGKRTTIWQEHRPQDNLYLIAGDYVEYHRQENATDLYVFLLKPDKALAEKYFAATSKYLKLYSRLLGDYPYQKFAMVENYWQTGLGMPSFTLLGSRVIRFPFILDTSYPHEIVHNWFGNGVYVDYGQGNWAEGLTAYLSDHFLKERKAKGHDYRRSVLQKYTDYVSTQSEFSLRQFRGKYDVASEAVGYGKTMMFFHMLRRKLGDETFLWLVRHFYQEHQFGYAGFDDFRRQAESLGISGLESFFTQWLERIGSPRLMVEEPALTRRNDGYLLQIELKQSQPGAAYQLDVPLYVFSEDGQVVQPFEVAMTQKTQRYTLQTRHKPALLVVDPLFELFRRVDDSEIPPALSQIYGSKQTLVIVPADAPAQWRRALQSMAQALVRRHGGGWQWKLDKDLAALPADRPVLLLGWQNRFTPLFSQSLPAGTLDVSSQTAELNGQSYRGHSLVMAARTKQREGQTLLWIAPDNLAAIPGLARKLPHYRKYSYLAFSGEEPHNVEKGQWRVERSNMSRRVPGSDVPPILPALPREAPLM